MANQIGEGMTVNERLYRFGLMDCFDDAAKAGDITTMVQVLLQTQMTEAQATQTAQVIVADPKRYGY